MPFPLHADVQPRRKSPAPPQKTQAPKRVLCSLAALLGQRRPLWKMGWSWVLFPLLLVHCAPVSSLNTLYPRLRIQLHTDQVRWLRVQIAPCKGNITTQTAFLRERSVNLSIGTEDFFLPQLPQGDVELVIEAYQEHAQKRPQGTPFAYARHRWHRNSPTEPYPTLLLQNGTPPAHLLCAPPPETTIPPQPDLPNGWFPSPPAASLPWFPSPPNGMPALPTQPGAPPQTPQLTHLAMSRAELALPKPAIQLQSNGQQLLLLQQSPPALALFDTKTLPPTKRGVFALPKECRPHDVTLEGTKAAVLCGSPPRLHWLDFQSVQANGNWEVLSPPQGLEVPCQQPTALRFWGELFVVACFDTHQVFFLQPKGTQLTTLLKIPVGEGPIRLTYREGSFYVLNALSNTISSFRIQQEGLRKSQITLDQVTLEVDRSTHNQPLEMAINAHHLVTVSALENNIMIRPLPLSAYPPPRYLALPQGTIPRHVRLLGHTAIISSLHQEELVVIDLRQQTITQRIPLLAPRISSSSPIFSASIPKGLETLPKNPLPKHFGQTSTSIEIAGTRVFAISHTQPALKTLHFSEHPGFQSLRLGHLPHAPLLADPTSHTPLAWIFEQDAERLFALDIQKQEVILERSEIPTPSWVRMFRDHLVFVDRSLRKVGMRPLQDPQYTTPLITLEKDICDGTFFEETLYFLHCQDASITQLKFLPAQDILPARLDVEGNHNLASSHATMQAKGILFFSIQEQKYVLTTDTISRALVLYPIPKEPRSVPIEPLRKVHLPGIQSGIQQLLALPKNRFALLTQLGRLYLFEASTLLDPQKRLENAVHLGVFAGSMTSYGRDLLLTDPQKNQLLLFDPERQEIRLRLAVDSQPTSMTPISKGALLTTPGNQNLLFVPLPPAR